ncbi:MarR family transcriptional regulator [Leucobacter allii]|uniref:MarR family winged helix-turn-helix transcriptional regulator n=1 Tax=Leucobacter allii TaxID=2932247 RepID=UPI001FD4DA48|nr:MarR family transcriptional regulator [Leucobacter allii]UOR00673.1 MarR family transcriptional regulator [Leucobacter allii]
MTDETRDGRTIRLAQRWCALQSLHDRIDAHVERELQREHGISVREFSLLSVLGEQHDGDGGHLQMKELAAAVVLSQSATTRLVGRLEDRGLLARYICPTDRRGIYTDVSDAGRAVLVAARPTNDRALAEALADVAEDPELAPLARVLRGD